MALIAAFVSQTNGGSHPYSAYLGGTTVRPVDGMFVSAGAAMSAAEKCYGKRLNWTKISSETDNERWTGTAP